MRKFAIRGIPILAALLLSCCIAHSAGAAPAPPKAGADAKCPICGMFVAKYPEWVVTLTFKDSASVFFDGCKDMFSYYLAMKKNASSMRPTDLLSITVKDYYDLKPADGKKAWYVLGSDVYGPMGKELIPFRNEADAREFFKDHKGKRIIRFGDVTPETLKALE